MAGETDQPRFGWFKKLNPWQKGGAFAVGIWAVQQAANYAYKSFLDGVFASPELAALMDSLNQLLTDRLVLGLMIASALYAFGPSLWRWFINLDFEWGSDYWKRIRPKSIAFRVVNYINHIDVIMWAEFENKGEEYSLALQVHGWKAQISGQAADYTQPIGTATLLPGESQYIRFPRIRVPRIGPGVLGSLEIALLVSSPGSKPSYGLYHRVDFEFEEYGDGLKFAQVQVIDMVPQDRTALDYKTANRMRRLREEKGLIIPGIASTEVTKVEPDTSPSQPLLSGPSSPGQPKS